ncbi:serine hydrolase domain-containing protein [Heyndrickxia vini]|uniref:Beta-lactamase family protein n=1 Tax=Heyndrickxia vini TaxID=1476025 RepID=A0ABX7DZ28_9BACI|nr:serine hydrolase domain-containing protein [Heyndrickxia vini]QQZ08738.1 beta-lactamase family protein [Heyndrickxia vini]
MGLNLLNIKERMEHYRVAGLSIASIENGKMSTNKNYGVIEANTNQVVNNHSLFSACSISKFLTGMLIMKLAEQGLLQLDEDVNKRLKAWKIPNNKFTRNKKVSLRHLLSHQSGIIDPDGGFTELTTINHAPSMVELLEGSTPYCKIPIEVKIEPVTDFHYSDANFCIIQQLIEDVTEKPFTKVVHELIFEPLEMEDSTFSLTKLAENVASGHHKNGQLVDGKYPIYPYPAASGLWTTPTNLAQLVLELMQALQGESKLGISANRVKEMISAQGSKEWTGLGVFLEGMGKDLEISSLGWGVGFQCIMTASPYQGKGLVIMTNTDLGVHQMKGLIGEIYHSFTN